MNTVTAHYVINEETFRRRIAKLMAESEEFEGLSAEAIAVMSCEVVRQAVIAETPFGTYQLEEVLREAVERLCAQVPVTVLGNPEEDFAEWLELLTWEPALIA